MTKREHETRIREEIRTRGRCQRGDTLVFQTEVAGSYHVTPDTRPQRCETFHTDLKTAIKLLQEARIYPHNGIERAENGVVKHMEGQGYILTLRDKEPHRIQLYFNTKGSCHNCNERRITIE